MTTKRSDGMEYERTGKRTRATCLTNGFYVFRPCSGQENQVITLVDCIIQAYLYIFLCNISAVASSVVVALKEFTDLSRATHFPTRKLP